MKMVPLGEVAEIVSGATPKTSIEDYWGGDILWATPADLSRLDGAYIGSTPRTITSAGLRSCAAQVLPLGSVLLSSRAPIGHVAINTEPMATNQGFKSLVPHPDRADAKYLYHWLRGHTEYLQSLGNGATFKEVSKAVVSKIEIPLPPLDEQRRIAAILDHANDLCEKRSQAMARIDQLVLAVFTDSFGDPIRNQKGWPMLELGDLGEWHSGTTPPRAEEHYFRGETPWYSSGELGPLFTSGSAECVSEDAFRKTSLKPVPAGALMLGMYDTAAFKSSIASKDCACNQAIAFSRLDPDMVETVYVYFAIKLASERLRQLQRGIRQKNLNLSIVRSIKIPLAPLDLQATFARQVAALGVNSDLMTESADQLRLLFNALQSRAFSGQL